MPIARAELALVWMPIFDPEPWFEGLLELGDGAAHAQAAGEWRALLDNEAELLEAS